MGRKRKTGQGLPERVYPHHGAYWYVDREGDWHRLGARWDREAKRKWSVLSEQSDEYGTFAWWLDAFLVRRKELVEAARLAQRTYEDNEKEAEYLKAFFGKMDPAEVEPEDVGLYLEKRGAVAPVRANREKALLSAFYTWMLLRSRESGVKVNPCRGVKRNPEQPRGRVIEDVEYTTVHARAAAAKRSKAVARLMVLIYRSAQRPEDLLVACPRWIRTVEHEGRDVRVLRVRQLKTGAVVDIALEGELDQVLRECMGSVVDLDRPFICTRRGKPFTHDGIAAMFRRHVAACKITDFGLYDIRAKAATDMFRTGVPIERISELLGHDSITTTEIYIKARLPGVAMPNTRQLPHTGKEREHG